VGNASPAALKLFCEEVGVDSIPNISTIEKKKDGSVYKQAEYNPKNATKLLVFDKDEGNHESYKPSTYWKKEKVDLDAGGIYVNITRYKVNGDTDPAEYIESMDNILDSLGDNLNNVTIVGAKDSVVDKLAQHKGWKTLPQYVESHPNLPKRISVATALNRFESGRTYLQNVLMELSLDATKPCGKFVERVKLLKKSVRDRESLIRLQRVADKFQVKLVDKSQKIDLDKEWEAVEKCYPLFNELDCWTVKDSKKGVKEYIDALDMVKF
jgi:hypothetical protein